MVPKNGPSFDIKLCNCLRLLQNDDEKWDHFLVPKTGTKNHSKIIFFCNKNMIFFYCKELSFPTRKTAIFHHRGTNQTRLQMQTRLYAEHIKLASTARILIVTLSTCESERPPQDPHVHPLKIHASLNLHEVVFTVGPVCGPETVPENGTPKVDDFQNYDCTFALA